MRRWWGAKEPRSASTCSPPRYKTGMTVEPTSTALDLAYAPPVLAGLDPILIAATVARKALAPARATRAPATPGVTAA